MKEVLFADQAEHRKIVKKNMLMLMKDVVRIHPSPRTVAPITIFDRMSLIHKAKYYIPLQVAEVEDYKKKLDAAVLLAVGLLAKRVIIKQHLAQAGDKVHARFRFMYPGYNIGGK